MSRIGRKLISVPTGVEVGIDGQHITVKGPKGELSLDVLSPIKAIREDNVIRLERSSDSKYEKSLHGLYRSLVNNMVIGVSDGFSKILEIVGTGYRATKNGKKLEILVGYFHPVIFEETAGIMFEVPNQTTIVVKGIDKQLVGEIAAEIRSVRKPEPYKGKGIRYQGEYVRKKVGKTGA
ncbi:MAG: 50S ribosomal protein L6 [Actinobacteria bacterium]|nr:50S ribosomal protein L6 [Actinomycetota bacterium]